MLTERRPRYKVAATKQVATTSSLPGQEVGSKMQQLTKKVGIVAAIAAGVTTLGSLSSPAYAEDAAGCTTRLLTAEGATIDAYAPGPVLEGPVIGVTPGDPERLAGDTSLNARYFVDCVV